LFAREGRLPDLYTIVPANEKEYEPLADLLTCTPAAIVITDKGFCHAPSPPTTAAKSHQQADAIDEAVSTPQTAGV